MSAPDPAPESAGETPERTVPTGTRLFFHAVAAIVRPSLNLAVGKTWRGADQLPDGGFIGVANHVTELDPLAVAHAVYRTGRTPHFLAKDSLFRVRGLGGVLRGLRQVPVARGTRDGGASLEAAHEVLRFGGAVLVYPEGTLTRDPQMWPMRSKTGAARLALKTGYPLVPITQWGVHELLGRYAKLPRPFPRKHYTLQFGEAIDLSDLRQRPVSRTTLQAATTRIEEALTAGVAALRGEEPPEQIWDPAEDAYVPRRHDAGSTPGSGQASETSQAPQAPQARQAPDAQEGSD
ncbi:lysophospholipid acyltransferase family protein [Nesterenkonia aerolata]|uniref:Lysophospholipid acyltransferase family protein n=1 Tax=Nesterenkonia aerolata TaxID=3074079 RepID=A0ABU2DQ30_9MICC|nr:lysophospholipid acyltransferase family protein [Nesterenkonia sp. LY-0111]MDR8018531.1 lysophospholipid acyltransferase family protein [Nesterenkonia sp. LY-0111]